MGIIRILLIADTHLGFDLPFRPRIKRRRRGPDFFANFEQALMPALKGQVHAVVHGGDILYRSKVPPRLVEMAFEPLKQVADSGTPVYLVPGNHERAAIPHAHLAEHPNIHLFEHPRTFILQTTGGSLALAGFPFVRTGIRKDFLNIVAQTGWQQVKVDGYALCIHQSVDGATVGPGAYAPVFYPGSIERTSFAEKNESKGYLILEFETQNPTAGALKRWTFHELPARPMIQLDLHAVGMQGTEIQAWIQSRLFEIPQDSIVKLKVRGKIPESAMAVFSAPSLRALAPETMNINVTLVDYTYYKNRRPSH
jgi:DNA repair exonuclease SbcCD nuclease subunit